MNFLQKEKSFSVGKLGVLSFRNFEYRTGYRFALVPSGIKPAKFLSPDYFGEDTSLVVDLKTVQRWFSSPVLLNHRKNGVFFSYEEYIIAPRDTRGKEGNAFLKDLCMIMGVGMVETVFGNAERDLYLAEKLNDVSQQLLIYYNEDEVDREIIRPLGVVRAPYTPKRNERKSQTRDQRERSERAYEKAKRRHSARVKELWDESITPRLILEYGEEGAEEILRKKKVKTIRVEPSFLQVLSQGSSRAISGKYVFTVYDPCVIEEHVLTQVNKTVTIPKGVADRFYITPQLIESEGCLFFGSDEKGDYVIVPASAGFMTDFCKKIGINKVAGGRCGARDIYLAKRMSNAKGTIKMVLRDNAETFDGVRIYSAVKCYSGDEEGDRVNMAEIVRNIGAYCCENGFAVRRSVKRDLLTIIEYTMVDGAGNPVHPEGMPEVDLGIEFSFSEDVQRGFRLSAVFYYKDALFYAGYDKYYQTDKNKEHGCVYVKRKKYTKDISERIIRGFFKGREEGESQYGIYDYLLEQSGLLKDGSTRSPYVNGKVNDGETRSVFSLMRDERVESVRATFEKIINKELFDQFLVVKNLGKKKLRAIADASPDAPGTMLDVVMKMAELARDDSIPSYRIVSMQTVGNLLGYYGYTLKERNR